jgi:hypothetical protein
LRIAELLDVVCRADGRGDEVDELRARIATVADGARCSLATQQQVVATSLFKHFGADIDAHVDGRARCAQTQLVAELVDIDDGVAQLDEHHRDKQPDWTYGAIDSGKTPAERLGEHRVPERLDR